MVTNTSVGGIVLQDANSDRTYTLTVNRVGAMKIQ